MVSAASNLFPGNGARPFVLRPDWNGLVQQREVVDVNLGHTPESFVRAAHAQITGQAAPEAQVKRWARELRENPRLRRVDLVRLLAKESDRFGPAGRGAPTPLQLCYGDPWQAHPQLLGAPERRTKREVGAILVAEPAPEHASTHALAMDWRRELTDAKWAGLDFLLLSAPGVGLPPGQPEALVQALSGLGDPVKLALLDRCESAASARTLYEAKWQPFFRQVSRLHWYRFKGKPLIYFHDASAREPRASSELLAQLKQLFEAEFGETPFLCQGSAQAGGPPQDTLVDASFTWFTFDLPEKRSRSTVNGHVIDHAMVRWDSVGRDRPGELSATSDLLVKGSELLEQVLHDSSDAELLVLATWNDPAEGTGINRNYDYWVSGSWLSPEHFMRKVRVSQSTESFKSARIGNRNVIG